MASSLVHHPGLATSTTVGVVPGSGFGNSASAVAGAAVGAAAVNAVAASDLSGLEGLVNAAAAHDPASYYHHHHQHHAAANHIHAGSHHHAGAVQASHQMHHGYNQHFSSAAAHHATHHAPQRSYFEESTSSLLGLGSLASSTSGSSVTNNESYSPNSTTNNLPSSTVKIKSGKIFGILFLRG